MQGSGMRFSSPLYSHPFAAWYPTYALPPAEKNEMVKRTQNEKVAYIVTENDCTAVFRQDDGSIRLYAFAERQSRMNRHFCAFF